MNFFYRFLSLILVGVILFSHTVYAVRISRDELFSDFTLSENSSILDNPGGLWRKAENGDQNAGFTSSKAVSNLKRNRASNFVFLLPRKNQIYSTEMEVSSGKTYEFSSYIRSSRSSRLIVRIRWEDNTTTRYKVESLPVMAKWNKMSFHFKAPEGARSYSVIHEMVGAGTIGLGKYGSKDLSEPEPIILKLDEVLPKKTVTMSSGGGGGGGGGGSSTIIVISPSGTGSSGTGSTATGSETGTGTTGTGSETGTGTTGTGSETGTGTTGTGSETGTGTTGTGSETGTGTTGTGSETGTGTTGTGSETGTGTTGTGSETGTGTTGTGSETGTGTTGTGAPSYTCSTSLVINACMEDESSPGIPNGWNQGGFGDNVTLFTYPSEGNHGSGLNLLISAYTDGDSKWYFNEVAVTPAQSYTYNVAYKSDAPSRLTVRYTTNTGIYLYDDIAALNPSATWTQDERVIVVPADVTTLTIFHVLAQVGNLSIDEAYLTERVAPSGSGTTGSGTTGTGSTGTGTTGTGSTGSGVTGTGSGFPCPSSLVVNPCMEDEISPGVPNGWNQGTYGDNTTLFTYPSEGNHDRGLNLLISAYTDGDSKWFFNDVSVNAGDIHRYQVEYKSDAPSKLTARYTTASGDVSYLDIANLPTASTWTHFEQLITIPSGVVSMTIFHTLAQLGSLSIDEALLSSPILYTGSPFASPMISFSFDDGWLSQKQNAIPALDTKGYKGTFAIITNEMLNADLQLPENQVYMNTTETLSLQTSGHEIASHTLSHANLPTLDASGMTDEIVNSRNILLGTGFAPVSTIVFPYGEHNTQVVQIARDAGYTAGRDDVYGYNTKDTDKFGLYVQNVGSGTTLSQVQNWIDTAYTNNLWLILMLHQVDTSGGDYSVDPTTFSGIVDYVSTKNIEVITIGQGISRMN